MIDFARERWTIANAEGRLLHIVGKDNSEFICVTDNRDYARLVAAAPEMYELLKMLNESSNDIEVSNMILKSKKLLACIDDEEAQE